MRAEVFVNPDRVISEVSAGIFGSFIENLGACIYGGVYDPGSPAADEDGFRMDVIETAKKNGSDFSSLSRRLLCAVLSF